MNTPGQKSRWSRMGGVVRRASLLTVSRPSTPSIASSDPDTDSISVKNINTTPAALAPPTSAPTQQSTAPSPIAESPAREAAAALEDTGPIGPSPLAQGVATASPDNDPIPPEIVQTSPVQDYTPPPLIDSSAVGPGGFSDESDDLPQSQIIRDPSRAPSFQQPTESADGHQSNSSAVEPHVVDEPADSKQPEEPIAAPEPDTPPPRLDSYFDLPLQDEPLEEPRQPADGFKESIEENTSSGTLAPTAETTTIHPDEPQPTGTAPSYQPEMPTPAHEPPALPPATTTYPMPSYELNTGQEVWGGVAHEPIEEPRPAPSMNGDASDRSRVSSIIRIPVDDPFADPIAPRVPVSHEEPAQMPSPHGSGEHHHMPSGPHEEPHGAIIMPLPAIHEVVPSKSIHEFPSVNSVKASDRGQFERETDETRPLLSRPGSPKITSYLRPSVINHNFVNVSPQSGAPAPSPAINSRLHDLGWIEYQLPDGTVYYVHPTQRVTTDIDLRVDKKLDVVTSHAEHFKDSGCVRDGTEVWLRESGSGRCGTPVLSRSWVDHKKRSISFDHVRGGHGDERRMKRYGEDDQLDIEYRYWSFMEAHPAHISLPVNARVEAMDVLTWAWTDRLLPSHRKVPAPFTQEECQELMSLLRSFDDQGDFGLQSVVHTRIVSRILLRVAQWRQAHFRPNKPLPLDASSNAERLPKYHRPFRRALFDFVISCLCLGIPYVFFERAQHHRIDEESGLRSAAPFLVIGACTCLVAAIVMSASVTFLSLPGLDNFARVAGLVAILFASFSMASTIIALFRYKADLERPVSHIGGEGLMMLSRRSIVLSLPLVFLAYSIVGFITGVVLYSFRGAAVADPSAAVHHFEGYTRWTVVGVLGGLAGISTTSLLLLRR